MDRKTLVGERIRAARTARGLSQQQLGELLDVSFQAVSTWESGKFIPDSDHLPALAEALDLSLNTLFAEKDPVWELKPVNYDFSHMFTFVKGRAQMLGMPQALAVLGYSQSDVAAALKGLDAEALPLEELVRQALRRMVK